VSAAIPPPGEKEDEMTVTETMTIETATEVLEKFGGGEGSFAEDAESLHDLPDDATIYKASIEAKACAVARENIDRVLEDRSDFTHGGRDRFVLDGRDEAENAIEPDDADEGDETLLNEARDVFAEAYADEYERLKFGPRPRDEAQFPDFDGLTYYDPWRLVREPTPDEERLVGRDLFPKGDGPSGDLVLRIGHGTDKETLELLDFIATAFAMLGKCDQAHVLPGVGIYLEE
jgi:hypothetical protein